MDHVETQNLDVCEASENSFESLKQAIHYICHIAAGMTLGSIRLNKILLFSDIEYYGKYGRPITQDEYVKGPQGPYQQDVRRAVAELKKQRILSVTKRKLSRCEFTDYHSLKPVNAPLLDDEQLAILSKWTEDICSDYKSHEISEVTHNAAWRIAHNKEKIPLAAQIVGMPSKVSQKDIAWAVQ